jgi:dTDP-4-dehydrorhamnose reductase
MQSTKKSGVAWITGAGGLIGNCLSNRTQGFDVVPLTHPVLDLTDFVAVTKRFEEEQPKLVFHCAAMTRVPDCEKHPDAARRLNVEATAHLAELAAEAQFIFFSTDLVFDGRKGNYSETDSPNPLSVYAATKLEAENIVLKNPRHTVIRTSLNSGASPRKTAYNEVFQTAWKNGHVLDFFTDEYRCPIPASVTVRAVWELAAGKAAGLYHLAGSERLSREAIGKLAAARHSELNPQFRTSSLRDYKGSPRPPDVSLNCGKIQKLLSFPLPGLTQYLRDHPEEPF